MGKKNNNLVGQIMKWNRIGALLAPGAGWAFSRHSNYEKIRHIGLSYWGYDIREHKVKPEWIARGWTPYLMSCLITRGIQKINGIIRGL